MPRKARLRSVIRRARWGGSAREAWWFTSLLKRRAVAVASGVRGSPVTVP
jgi:hypothetical protein